MKYIVLLGDGMSDYPVAELGNQTPLAAAHKPYMDFLAQHGAIGMAQTIPEGMPPGSDTANMAVMGFSPAIYYSGRSPLEAVSLGIELADDDVTFRCNLVTLSDEPEYANKTMLDYSAGEISSEEAAILLRDLAVELTTDDLHLYPGISYRHCLVLHHSRPGAELTPPHDISGRPIRDYLPKGRHGELLYDMMRRSQQILENHAVNIARRGKGENPANSIWFWGEGVKPKFDTLEQLYGVKGGVVCAVDLIKGLGISAGLRNITVPGATGGMVTNYAGKARAALQLLTDDCDFVYIHIEAPDECGHHGDAKAKVAAIEAIDREVLAMLIDELKRRGEDFRILLTPDHPTPLSLRTHTAEPVPFVLYDSRRDLAPNAARYTEEEAEASGLFLSEGPLLMKMLLRGGE